ncbi:glycine hydroxymethyltransferase [Trichosporon asahii var. asahii CBS 2479]|uniref:Glycine hydroxymethyltransferase n=1 Tax=Trichosporon asahii var. asahii (strain ATCC 90039 / CBS 2479 / JCM 2466 / KCTC 7840 / NBRC 103889/ NCYC 2677 / UAMH 7654) TaxID=1186058 RepID=J6EN45_TRIAS|nr:glycine hydroxymethyltransferase [Trichosporon asahii var. asahii CBS 2479]EJT45759.1 glycine hydroxymethyltransferase [Trichosporon asahii var. asahii CBS 2479]
MPLLRSLVSSPLLRTSLSANTVRPFVRMSSSVPVPQDFNNMLYQTLEQYDPEVNDLIEKETWRQFSGLELIASEGGGGRTHVGPFY